MNRICIYPKDIHIITGKSQRQSREILNQIKKHFQKEKHQPITINEFCQYMKLDIQVITPLIK